MTTYDRDGPRAFLSVKKGAVLIYRPHRTTAGATDARASPGATTGTF
jgi:hypothetical protein